LFISLVFRFRSFSWFSVLDFVFFYAVVDILGGGREERVYYFGMEGGRVTGLRDCCGRWWHFGYFWCSRLGVVEWVGGGLDGTALSFFFSLLTCSAFIVCSSFAPPTPISRFLPTPA
jgi:hypothetical protein